MSLQSTIQSLRAHADVADDAHRVKVRTGQLTELRERLARPPLSDLAALNAALVELQQVDVEIPEDLEENGVEVAKRLRELAVRLPGLRADEDLDFARACVASAEKYAQNLKNIVVAGWDDYVNQPQPAIDQELVEALANGGIDVEDIRAEFESADGKLFALRNRKVPGRGSVKTYRDAIEAMRRCGERIGEVVDSDIAEGIIESQTSAGISLTWFTPERVEKLRRLGIMDRFKVRLV
ncbi:hypothetical protein G6031_04285 [Dietzia sp. CQ4]|uniref:hypothetical protein n=1 Tax=Dietzia sp. (strain CQ4) TaxID=370437 RepID=UPI0015FDA5C5|nr:hypothetical protein [Dietzia sp. CQ4]MBB1033607.1 hypothetical protein [Dietzia sp. CQ4]